MKNLKTFLDRFKSKVEALKPTDNASQDQDEVDEIEEMLKNIEEQIEDIDAEMEDDEELSSQKPLIDKLSENKNDFNILKNKFNQKKDEIKSAHAKELLFSGQLKGVDKRKAERDVAADQVKEVDEQGQILDSIHEKVKGTNVNLENMNVEAKKQGEQIDRIGDKVITMDNTVKKTGNVMSDIERRICCRKCILVSGIILILLMNIIMAFLIFARMFGWPGFIPKPGDDGKKEEDQNPKPTLTTIKGIEYDDYDKGIDFEKFQGNELDFVMLYGGEGENKKDNCKSTYEIAKGKNIKVGLFWKITATDNDAALSQVNKAKLYLTENNLNLDYHFYFKFEGNTLLDDHTKTDIYCKNLGTTCGIILSQDIYNNKYKPNLENIKNIKYYWIQPYSSALKPNEEEKVNIWRLQNQKNIDGKEYNYIEAKK